MFWQTHFEFLFYRKTDSLRSARLLRSLFRRPYFVPQESEVSLVKHVFIDGDNAEKFTLVITPTKLHKRLFFYLLSLFKKKDVLPF